MTDEIEQRLAELEDAVQRLQRRRASPAQHTENFAAGTDPAQLWALEGLKARSPETGAVLYTGVVQLPTGGAVEWQYAETADDLLDQDWPARATAIAALGHPARLRILRAALNGMTSVPALMDAVGDGTSGKIYHHLGELTAAGWLTSRRRGSYEIPPTRVVPLLATVLAAGTPQ